MTTRYNLGDLEMLVLAAILRLEGQAYGVPIRLAVAETARREVSAGTVYKTLHRLEKKGLVSSRTGEATPVRGGRAKIYYSLEPGGAAALRATVQGLADMLDGTDLGAALS